MTRMIDGPRIVHRVRTEEGAEAHPAANEIALASVSFKTDLNLITEALPKWESGH